MQFKLRSKIVEFKSGGKVIGKVTVRQATLLDDQRLDDMERAAIEQNEVELKALGEKTISPEQFKLQSFRVNLYPKMAACSSGDIPTAEEMLFEMPTSESSKLWQAAIDLNPEWFEIFAEIEKMSADELKKKEQKPAELSPVSADLRAKGRRTSRKS